MSSLKVGDQVTIIGTGLAWSHRYGYRANTAYEVISTQEPNFKDGLVVKLAPADNSPEGSIFWSYQVELLDNPTVETYDIT